MDRSLLWLAAALLIGCGSGASSQTDDDAALQRDDASIDQQDGGGFDAAVCDQVAAESALRTALETAASEVDFTLLLRDQFGRNFSYSRGASSAQVVYESASTSKWVTAMTILRLVDIGVLSLDDTPGDYLSFWTDDVTSPLSSITLQQLLSFTSGLQNSAFCTNLPNASFASCVEAIYENNLASPTNPGTTFYYGPAHMQVAGLMAVEASQSADWTEVFADFKASTGLFTDAVYDLPSDTNPRLSGGMRWTASEYLEFLDAVFHQAILSPTLSQQTLADQLVGLTIEYSPAEEIGEEWHYGLGYWLECRSTTYCGGPQILDSLT